MSDETLYDDGDLYAVMTAEGTLVLGMRGFNATGTPALAYSIPASPPTVLFAQIMREQDDTTNRLSLSLALLGLCDGERQAREAQ